MIDNLMLLLWLLLVSIWIHPTQAKYLHRESYKGDVIYQIMTDRFFDGNAVNNEPIESAGLFDADHENWKMYWGGDFEGIRQKLPYLKELGITALWISPPYDNNNKKVVYNDVPNTAYHGYWARDFKRPEEHFGTWADFDALVRDAHSLDLKIIIDWAPNHTGPADPLNASFAERGALFDNGRFVGDYVNDTRRLFHHNGGIVDWDDPYESKFLNIADLADLDQTNAEVHRLLRDSLDVWLQRDIDGIRLDAIKHMTRGWQTSLADQVNSSPTPMFIFGEWYMGNFENPLLNEALRFSNQSGISQLDFLLNRALRDAFIFNHSFHELDSVINRLSKDYEHAGHNVVTFIDNHDMARFLTENNDRQALHQALVFLFTQRGTPCVYYGLEQYLHEDMNGGSDPWNRPMMPRDGFDKRSEAFQLIKRLSQLKQTSPALKWGDYRARYVSDDVLVYERKFGSSVVLVAINKSRRPVQLSFLMTSLPAGLHQNRLSDTPNSRNRINIRPTGSISHSLFLDNQSSAIWSYDGVQLFPRPMLGSVAPVQVRSGNRIALDGSNFGTVKRDGQVRFGGRPAPILSWSDTRIVATVPSAVPAGTTDITVRTSYSISNPYSIRILSGIQVPVTFTFYNIIINDRYTENVYLTGDVFELGQWSTDLKVAQGPMYPRNSNATHSMKWFFTVSLPGCQTVEFLYFIMNNRTNLVEWEPIDIRHRYTVPCNGLGQVEVLVDQQN